MLWILIAAAVCAGDLLVKHYIDTHKEENCHEPVVGGHIIITRFHNPGAMLGWMKDKPKMLMGVTILGIGVLAGGLMGSLYKKKSVLIRLGLALLLGGAASNAYDRIMKKRSYRLFQNQHWLEAVGADYLQYRRYGYFYWRYFDGNW